MGEPNIDKNPVVGDEEELKMLSESSNEEIENQMKELKLVFDIELAELPHIAEFIERLKTIIRRQQKKLGKIYKKLKNHRLRPVVICKEAAVQTDNVPDTISSLTPNNTDSNAWGDGEDLAEEVKQVAEQALTRTGFVFEPTSGMYYDYKTGYYYNAEARMYYDGNSGRYLSYNEDTKQYTFLEAHSTKSVVSSNKDDQAKGKKRRREEEAVKEQEEGEISDSSGESDHLVSPKQEVAATWPPCLRLMVTSSSAPGVGKGRLFLMTCQGGEMGREGNPLVLLPERAVSKVHLRVSFSGETYQIVDVGSRNGTWLNGKRIAPALQESEPTNISHGDELRLGSTTLSVHIHSGQDTCGECEPGLQQEAVEVSAPLPAALPHRAALRSLKKRFGVTKNAGKPSKDVAYTDRAEKRRTDVGSSHPAEKTETACLSQSISIENKGFKMLAKMGWSSGQSLGKSEQGISEPVALVSNVGTTGLGASPSPALTVPTTLAANKKLRVLKMTQTRYNQQPAVPQDGSSDDE